MLCFSLCACSRLFIFFFFFFSDTAPTEIYTILFVGSVRCVQETEQERFGKKPAQYGGGGGGSAQAQKTPLELAKLAIQQIKTAYPSNIFMDKAKVCFSTLQIFIRNVLNNPSEEKYRKINLTNQNFQTRVGELFGGIAVLKHAGFQEQDNFLVLNEPNIKLLQEIEASLTNEINYS
eukprot:TRINITY_DN22314_c0_g1_i4.p1 TRINITY_DN22314_c0_g1~~TRINITY_DN22314_c0_g1_i4.p1  ORF type:complete len:177 (+),score=16.58 TRINITY_DN22314_c0_g1_i4:43-573(+)